MTSVQFALDTTRKLDILEINPGSNCLFSQIYTEKQIGNTKNPVQEISFTSIPDFSFSHPLSSSSTSSSFSHFLPSFHCTALFSSPIALSSPSPPPLCAACRWHRGMQIGTECKESDLKTHFCSRAIMKDSAVISPPFHHTPRSFHSFRFPSTPLMSSSPYSNYPFSLRPFLSSSPIPPYIFLAVSSHTYTFSFFPTFISTFSSDIHYFVSSFLATPSVSSFLPVSSSC